LLATSAELRLDQIAYMIIAAHRIHSKVDLHPYSHSRARVESRWQRSGNRKNTNNPGNWHSVCQEFFIYELKLSTCNIHHSDSGGFCPRGAFVRGLWSGGLCPRGAYVRFP